MPSRQPSRLPRIWLVSDARNDASLATTLARLPHGSGLIFRHYHLDAAARRAAFARVARIARAHGHAVVLAGTIAEARAWRADGAYGPASKLARGPAALRLVTAHTLGDIAAAHRARATAILLSPAFATASHPGTSPLGAVRWRLLAARASAPVIALGGMDAKRARQIGAKRWAAIDGILRKPT